MNNKDILYLTYDAGADRYVGTMSDSDKMIFISPTGAFLFEKKIDLKQVPNFCRQTNSFKLILVAANNLVNLIQVNDSFRGDGKVLNIWDYDLNTQKATLTYKAPQNIRE